MKNFPRRDFLNGLLLAPAALMAQAPASRTIEPTREASPGMLQERLHLTTVGGKQMNVIFRYPRVEPGKKFPAIVGVTPWAGTFGGLHGIGIREPAMLVHEGIGVAYFDFPGQEGDRSPGQFKDKYGPERQLNVRDVIRYVASRKDVDKSNIGVVSFSSGNILAAGALTRPPGDPPVKFWIDAEGPTTRDVLLLNIPGTMAATAQYFDEDHQGEWMAREFLDASLGDEEYWKQREAFRLMKKLRCRFLRLQGEEDHVHNWYYGHAIHALNSAMASDAPWVRGGNGPVNVWHRDAATLDMLPGRVGRQGERVLAFIKEMINQPPLGQMTEDGAKPPRPERRFAGGRTPRKQ